MSLTTPDGVERVIRHFRLLVSHPHADEVVWSATDGQLVLPDEHNEYWLHCRKELLIRVCVDRVSEDGIVYNWWCGTSFATPDELRASTIPIYSVDSRGGSHIRGHLRPDNPRQPGGVEHTKLLSGVSPDVPSDDGVLTARANGANVSCRPSNPIFAPGIMIDAPWCMGGKIPVSVYQTTIATSAVSDPQCSVSFWQHHLESALAHCGVSVDDFKVLPRKSSMMREILRQTLGAYLWSVPYAIDRSTEASYTGTSGVDGTWPTDQFWRVLNASSPGMAAGDCEDFVRTGIDLFYDMVRCQPEHELVYIIAQVAKMYHPVAVDVCTYPRMQLETPGSSTDIVLHQTLALMPILTVYRMRGKNSGSRRANDAQMVFIDGVVWTSDVHGVDSRYASDIHHIPHVLARTGRVCVTTDTLYDKFYRQVVAMYIPSAVDSETVRCVLPMESGTTYGLPIREFIRRVDADELDVAVVNDHYDRNRAIVEYATLPPTIPITQREGQCDSSGEARFRVSFNLNAISKSTAVEQQKQLVELARQTGYQFDGDGEWITIGTRMLVWVSGTHCLAGWPRS